MPPSAILSPMNPSNRYPLIDGVRVDLDALLRLAHRCEPTRCTGRRGCCETYEVTLDPGRIGTIVGALPHAARYAKTLVEDGEFVDPFDDTDGGTCLATDEDGRCVFAYRDRRGATLCSLHSAALDLDLPPAQTKPTSCALWPLALTDHDPPLLTVQSGIHRFPCNRSRRPAKSLHPGIAQTLAAVFGAAFLRELAAAIDA